MTCVDTGTCRTAAWGTNPPPTIGDTTLVGKSGYFREIILRRGALPLGGSGMGGGPETISAPEMLEFKRFDHWRRNDATVKKTNLDNGKNNRIENLQKCEPGCSSNIYVNLLRADLPTKKDLSEQKMMYFGSKKISACKSTYYSGAFHFKLII